MSKEDIKILENPDCKKDLEFLNYQNKLYGYLETGDLDKGLTSSMKLVELFPEKITLAYSWITTFYEALERDEDILDTLEKGFTQGAWWSEKALSEGFSMLGDHPQFQELKELGEKVKKEKALTRPEIRIRTPDGYTGENLLPLLLVLHGRYDSNLSFAQWEGIADEHDIIVASLQSSQMISGGHFVWDNEEKSLDDLHQAYQLLLEQYAIDPNQIILAGVSQGTAILMKALFSSLFRALGFINVIPAISKFIEWFPGNYPKEVTQMKGYFIAGEKDIRFEKTKSTYDYLVDNGLDCQMHSLPELGHQIPDNLKDIVLKGLDFILSE